MVVVFKSGEVRQVLHVLRPLRELYMGPNLLLVMLMDTGLTAMGLLLVWVKAFILNTYSYKKEVS